jgi:hypothetical protein
MSSTSPPPEDHHTCHHPGCCPSEGELMAETHQEGETPPGQEAAAAHPATGALKRSLLGFLAFFGIYASSSVCPFCGTPGCPVGVSGAALVGGGFAVLWQYGKQWFGGVVRFFKKIFF